MPIDTKEAMDHLTAVMKDDPEYAWSWHCNLAMPIMDSTDCSHEQANRAAAALMQHVWGVDITKHPHWQFDKDRKEAAQNFVNGIPTDEHPLN